MLPAAGGALRSRPTATGDARRPPGRANCPTPAVETARDVQRGPELPVHERVRSRARGGHRAARRGNGPSLAPRSRRRPRRSTARTTATGSGSARRRAVRACSTLPATRRTSTRCTWSATAPATRPSCGSEAPGTGTMAPTSEPSATSSRGEPTLRRRLVLDAIGMSVSATAFGLVYGLAARTAGFTSVEAVGTSILVLAGASQFAAVGLVAGGAPWRRRSAADGAARRPTPPLLCRARAVARRDRAHPARGDGPRDHGQILGLAIAHFRRVGHADVRGFWLAAAFVCLPWVVATGIGAVGAGAIPQGRRGCSAWTSCSPLRWPASPPR